MLSLGRLHQDSPTRPRLLSALLPRGSASQRASLREQHKALRVDVSRRAQLAPFDDDADRVTFEDENVRLGYAQGGDEALDSPDVVGTRCARCAAVGNDGLRAGSGRIRRSRDAATAGKVAPARTRGVHPALTHGEERRRRGVTQQQTAVSQNRTAITLAAGAHAERCRVPAGPSRPAQPALEGPRRSAAEGEHRRAVRHRTALGSSPRWGAANKIRRREPSLTGDISEPVCYSTTHDRPHWH